MSETKLPTASPATLLIAGFDSDEGPTESFLVDDDKPRFKIDAALVQSITTHGVVEPVTVREIDGKFWVVKGRRRVLHAREAEKRAGKSIKIAYILQAGGDTADAKTEDIVSNMFRAGHSEMAQARKAKHLLDVGEDEAKVAAALGVSKSTLKNRLKLLDLSRPVQKAVDEGRVSVMAALELHGLDNEKQAELLEKLEASESKKGQAKTAAQAAGRSKANGSEGGITKGMLKKLLDTEAAGNLDPMAGKVIRWIIGELETPNSIPGLAACVKEIEADALDREAAKRAREKAKAKKASKKAPPRVAA